MEETLVSASRVPHVSLRLDRFPGNVTILTKEMIRASGASNLPALLSHAEGVSVADQQGFGLAADSTVNLRGIVNSARTNAVVLVDGVRQNRLTGDEVHWQAIPVNQIERIEIIRGGAGLIYGEGALGGVINILTAPQTDRKLEAETGLELGSFGWQQYTGRASGTAEALSYGVGYTRTLVTGYRESSESRSTSVDVHTGLQIAPGLHGDVSVRHSEDVTGFPGGLSKRETEQRRTQTNPFHGINTNELDQVSLDLTGGPWDGWTGLVNLFWKRWTQSSEDSIAFNSFTVTPSRGLNLRLTRESQFGPVENLLVSGLELVEDKATTGDRDNNAGPDSESNRQGYGLYTENTATLWDRLSLIAGVRFDQSRYQESLTFPDFNGSLRFQGWGPKVGATYVVLPERLTVFTSFSRPFKAPNVDDLSARINDGTFSFRSNASLQPQQADSYELGARWTHPKGSAGATWFYTTINDEILVNAIDGSQNQNFDTRRAGIELSARWQPPESRWRAYATYTGVSAKFIEGRFTGYTVPGTPTHIVNAGWGVSPLKSLWVDLDWQLVNDFYRINDMRNALGKGDNYGVLNVIARYALPQRAARGWPSGDVYFKIENVTNEEYVAFQSTNGTNDTGRGESPMPPIGFYGGVRLKF